MIQQTIERAEVVNQGSHRVVHVIDEKGRDGNDR